ncbi:alpha-1,3-galactosidase-related protein [Wenyingzhuangia sp. IMCC45533]
MIKKIALIFLLFVSQLSTNIYSQVINVSEFGIKPGKDVTLELNQLIKSLKGKKGVTLFFPKGQYDFYPENAVEQYRAVTNHDNSIKKMAFPLFGFENFTLDGNGSTFMFHGKICPITVENGNHTILKNFTIDWKQSFVNELKVLSNNTEENSFVAEVNSGTSEFEVKKGQIYFKHYDWSDPIGQNIAFDPKTSTAIWDTRSYYLSPKGKVTKLSDKTAKFTNFTKKTPPVGTIFAAYGPSPGGNRFAQAIHLSQTNNTIIENVTVYAAGGMAVIAERCENVTLDKLSVTSRKDRTFSTRADATHFVGCKGLIKVENCLLEHMLDDGINVHGAYVKVMEYIGNNKFICETSHVQQMGFIFGGAGDKVMLTSRETVLPIFETTIKEAEYLNEQRILLTVSEMPKKLPAGLLSFENLTWNPDLELRNNTIRDNRARAALITTKGNVIVENNFFSSQMHGILIEGDNKKWYESGGVKNVVIQNNTFENIGYGNGQSYPLFASPMLTPQQKLGDRKFHNNITFSNNTIKSFNGHLVHALSVKNLKIEGNLIEGDKSTYPLGKQLSSISLDYCEDVTIQKNKYKGFDWKNTIHVKENCTNVNIKKNKDLSK